MGNFTTDNPPGGLAPRARRGYRCHPCRSAEGSVALEFTNAQALALLSASILEALREGSGAATNGHLRGRSLRRGYAGAKMCRVRQEGIHSLNHPKDTSIGQSLETPKGDQGKGCALRPTHDSIYLAQRIDERWGTHALTPSALQRFVNLYGAEAVETGLRELYGFPPEEAIRSPYAYLDVMMRESLILPPEPPQGALW